MKSGFWKTDWFFGLVVVAVIALFNQFSNLIANLEQKAYDLGVNASSRAPSERVAVIAIDDASVNNIGRWPWSRDKHAKMIDLLSAAKAKVIGHTVFFFEPENPEINQTIQKLIEVAPKQPEGTEVTPLTTTLKEAEQKFNTDRTLAESSAKAGNLVLPVYLSIGVPQGNPDKPLPEFVLKSAVPSKDDQGGLSSVQIQVPIAQLGAAAAGVGNLSNLPDLDGGTRTEPLVVRYFDQYIPSLSLMIAAKSLNLSPADIKVQPETVTLGKLRIGTDPNLRMYTYFYKDRDGRPAFQVDSFYDVLTGKIPAAKYADKIVLIGATAAGVGTTSPTPVSAAMPPVMVLAHTVSSILQEHFFRAPIWAYYVEILLFLLIGAYLIALLPRLKAGTALTISGVLFIALLVTHVALMTSAGIWMQLMLPATLLLVGHAALVSKRFIMT